MFTYVLSFQFIGFIWAEWRFGLIVDTIFPLCFTFVIKQRGWYFVSHMLATIVIGDVQVCGNEEHSSVDMLKTIYMQCKYINGCHNWDGGSCTGHTKGTDMQVIYAYGHLMPIYKQ